jgi:hypothetical protein
MPDQPLLGIDLPRTIIPPVIMIKHYRTLIPNFANEEKEPREKEDQNAKDEE